MIFSDIFSKPERSLGPELLPSKSFTTRSRSMKVTSKSNPVDPRIQGISCDKNLGRRQLSVSDLLIYSAKCPNELFPLIDQQKYRVNASHAIYDADIEDATTEIDQYFQESSQRNFKGKMIRQSTTRSPASSPTTGRNTELHLNSPQTIKGQDTISSFRGKRQSFIRSLTADDSTGRPVTLTEPPLTPDFNIACQNTFHNSSFNCSVEYFTRCKRLKFLIFHDGGLYGDYFKSDKTKAFAKICLIPGNVQKQQMKLDISGRASCAAQAYFRDFTLLELKTMTIRVHIYMRQGILRRAHLVHECSIPLSDLQPNTPLNE